MKDGKFLKCLLINIEKSSNENAVISIKSQSKNVLP